MDLVYPYGTAAITGVIKSRPEDFQVFETLGFEPGGDGEHLFLQIEKSGLSTPELITRIAKDFSLHPKQIGYSGLKDKNALTTQWLSLHLPGRDPVSANRNGPGYRILRELRHRSKLRQGTHKSNMFRLRIREVEDFPETSRQQLESVAATGIANYFGRQRFGRYQDNVEQALLELAKPRLKRMRKSILISALRSYLFNLILAQRILQDSWRQPMDGDVFMLRGSHSIFSEALDESLMQRFESMDLSTTASLYGQGQSMLGGRPLSIEQQVFAENRALTDCLEQQGSRLQMRAMRVAVEDFKYEYDSARKILELELRLPPGSYMTTLLEHFLRTIDAG